MEKSFGGSVKHSVQELSIGVESDPKCIFLYKLTEQRSNICWWLTIFLSIDCLALLRPIEWQMGPLLSSSLVISQILFSIVLVDGKATCYFPDGTVEAGFYFPCNTTTEGSACCDADTSVCTTAGLCVSSAGWIYRGACTDKTWQSPYCPSRCLNGQLRYRIILLR